MAGKKMGRPLKEINKKQFENLCALFCTRKEIADFFECDEDTVNNWCKRTYQDENGEPMTFSAVYEKKKSKGKISLRRSQHRLAEKYPAMAIWLGKQELGQRDNIEVTGEAPTININVAAATEDDAEND